MPQDRKLWDAALREVQSQILFVARQPTSTSPQKRILIAIYLLCGDKIKNGPPAPAPTNRELASKYGVGLRTVTNWRREGCPFDAGQVKVLDWLSQRRYAPAGAKEKFSGQLTKRNSLSFISRDYWKALADVRQFKRDCITHGYEPPNWTKGFRATRRTKGIPTGHIAKRHQKGKKGAKPRRKANYGLKFLVTASKVAVATD